MKRDGANTSLWQYNQPDYASNSRVLPSGIVDVVVIGGGITGVTTALLLQKAGKLCVLLEAHTLGFGTTSGTTAHLNTMLDTSYDVIERNFNEEAAYVVANATKEAIELVRSHVLEYGIECGFSELPGYLFAQDETQSDELKKILEASQKVGIEVDYTQEVPVPIDFQKAIRFEGQAQFHPIQYLTALAEAFEREGGIILQNCPVIEVQDGETVHLATSLGHLWARSVVQATHIPFGVNFIHMKSAPYRSYALAVTLRNNQYPDAEVYDMQDPYHYYRTQEVEGKKYLIAGGEDHKTGHEESTDACFDRLEAYVRNHFDVEKVDFKWSSQYYEPTDGLPYIGLLPGASSNVYVATGYSGNGMTLSNVAALELRSLIVEGKSKYNELFSPSRVKLAGVPNFIKEQVDVVAQFFGKKIGVPELEQLVELAPGEGKVVKYEGDKVALYKDESGALHAVNPTCTHMGCSVSWNTSEKSWDCPCHGARYSCDGKVLTGPSNKNLEIIALAPEANKEYSKF